MQRREIKRSNAFLIRIKDMTLNNALPLKKKYRGS
jgi:hypothetical protein